MLEIVKLVDKSLINTRAPKYCMDIGCWLWVEYNLSSHDRQAALLCVTPLSIHKEQLGMNMNLKCILGFSRYEDMLTLPFKFVFYGWNNVVI